MLKQRKVCRANAQQRQTGVFYIRTEMVKRICREDGIEHCVRLLGPVSGQEKIDTFMKSDMFILPTYAENMPNTILEAMAAGLPVISTAVGAIPELIHQGENGFLIEPGDYQDLANRIEMLMENRELRTMMGAKSLEKVKKKYDFLLQHLTFFLG